MGFVKQAHEKLHDYYLNQSLGKIIVKRKPVNYCDAKNIGILFDSSQPDQRLIITYYANRLRSNEKKVKMLAFFNDKKPHNNFPFKYFTKNELDWLSRPMSNDVQDFIEAKFDILINLNLKPNISFDYITALSKAHLRVGPLTNKTFCYDFMIDTKNKLDLRFFIKQIEFYLKSLHSKKHEYSTV